MTSRQVKPVGENISVYACVCVCLCVCVLKNIQLTVIGEFGVAIVVETLQFSFRRVRLYFLKTLSSR